MMKLMPNSGVFVFPGVCFSKRHQVSWKEGNWNGISSIPDVCFLHKSRVGHEGQSHVNEWRGRCKPTDSEHHH